MGNIFTNYYEAASIIIFGIGFTTLMLQPNLVKKIIGINIMDTSIFLFLTSKGYITGRRAPIVEMDIMGTGKYINPLPSGLVLTGIVVSVCLTAFSLALTQRLYEKYGSLDIDEILLDSEGVE